jgi:hypothetical protein
MSFSSGGSGGGAISSSSDVALNIPGNGEVLAYESSIAKWKNVTLPTALGSGFALNVKDYGAIGDNTADDTAAIQAAIDATTIGGVVFLPAGHYKITSSLVFKSNLSLLGAGENSSFIHQASTTAHALSGVDLSHVAIRSLHLTGPGQGNGTGSGINFTLSGNNGNATFYVTMESVYIELFGVDGVAIATPIVSRFSRVISFRNGRHGINVYGDPTLQSDGTSSSFEACFPAGNWGAGYRLKQMAYTSLNGCAADANGIAYELDTCIGITANGCGSEEPYNFTAHQAGYTGLSWRISNTKATLNAPYMIGNINVAALITNNSVVTINNYYEGSPGNTDDPTNNPTTSLQVDAGCKVVLTTPSFVKPMNLAAGTTTQLPGVPQKRVTTLTDAATITPNADTTDIAKLTIAGNRTMAVPSGTPIAGQQLQMHITQDSTGSRTITWNAVYRFSGATATTLTTTPAKTDYLGFQYNAVSSTWDCIAERLNF